MNLLKRLRVYTIALVSEMLQDIDKAMWHCSLDMTSEFWVLEKTEYAKGFSSF